jgi:hypothetical protein
MTGYESKKAAARGKLSRPDQAWWDWYLSPPEDWRKKYGDPFVWTEQEKQLMLLQKLKEKNNS